MKFTQSLSNPSTLTTSSVTTPAQAPMTLEEKLKSNPLLEIDLMILLQVIGQRSK